MKIKYQQFLLLLSTTLLISFLLSYFIYKNQKEAHLKEVYAHLNSVSVAKAQRIEGIISSQYELVIFPATNPIIIENLKKYLIRPKREYQKNLIHVINQYVRKVPSFEKIHILSAEGTVVASNDPAAEGSDWSDNENFLKSVKGRRYLDGVHFDDKGEINIFLSSPIYEKEKLIGVMIIDKNTPEILSITGDFSGLGKTGETILNKKVSDRILFLTPLRHDQEAALKRSLPSKDTSTVSGRITKYKRDTVLISKDYIGKKVIASGRYIEETNWALVTKIDYAEAMEPVYNLRRMLLLFDALGILVSLAVAFFAGKYFSRPVEEMVESTNRIKRGNFQARTNEKTGIAELNTLAVSFNEMTWKLEKKIEQLDRYAYVISHDLKSPLNNFEGLLNIIDDEYSHKPLDAEGKEMILMMKSKINDMKEMIDNLLKTAKEEKKIKEPVNLYLLAHEVVSVLSPPPHFHIFIQHNLPTVKCHRASMRQILQNLIGNSIKYMDKEQPLIKVGSVEFNRHYQVCITDNGLGVPQEKQHVIFNSYEIAHANDQIESHGLGLSIVKQLVEEGGGKIWVESKEGKETRFYFTVPKD